jgi:recombination directionality factor gp3-like protein
MNTKFTRLTGDVGNVAGLMRLKRLGKIRLGIKKKSAKTGQEYPSAIDQDGNPIDYFVVPPEIVEFTGEKPKVLDAMFVSNDPEEVYQEKLAMYGSTTGLKCHGDGQTALRRNESGQWVERKCPCDFLKSESNPKGSCTAQGHLMVVLPAVSMWGYFQITTHSLYARAGILSSLKQLQQTIGRIAYIPLKLSRAPQDIVHDGKSKTHFIVGFVPDLTLPQIIELRTKPELMVLPAQYQIEAPLDTNPADDPVDVEVEDEEDGIDAEKLADMDQAQLDAVQAALREKQGQQAKKPTPIKPSPQQAPAPQGKPNGTAVQESFELPTPERLGPGPVPASQWAEVVSYVDANMDLCTLKADWKTQTKYDQVIRLTPSGQQNFLSFMREQAKEFPY